MRLAYDAETERFRAELAEWLEANRPSLDEIRTDPPKSTAHLPLWASAWQRRLFDAGLMVPGWPPELGGRNATPVQQMVYFEEFARLQLPRAVNSQGLSIIAPSIVDHGTDEQKARYAIPLLRGETTGCLGMSEPGAGSDLASLSTRAELRGDHFIVNGQKVWTSGAHHASFCFCFVRTDPSAPKHKGISVLLIDMDTPGITCRPLPNLLSAERADFNEVFFGDVLVPRSQLVGELNAGWLVGTGSLTHERGMLWIEQVAMLEGVVAALIDHANRAENGRRIADDPVFRDQLAQLFVDAQALKCLGYKGFAKFARGQTSPEHSVLKLFATEATRRLNLIAVEALGAGALDQTLLAQGLRAGASADEGSWMHWYFRSFAAVIAGGTPEIQRNIIAERVLGLPRS